MRNVQLLTLFASLVISCPALPWSTSALAAQVVLDGMGDDDPNWLWCQKSAHKVKVGQSLHPAVRGHSTNPRGASGLLVLPPTPASQAYFGWNPPQSGFAGPGANFPVTSGPLMYLADQVVKGSTPPGLYFIRLSAWNLGQTVAQGTEPIVGCLVDVVSELPDVEVSSFLFDPPQPGVTGARVRMVIRNNGQISPLLAVPWSIAIRKWQRFAPGGYVPGPVLGTGVVTNLGPGAQVDVSATDNLAGGVGLYDQIVAQLDPASVLGENDNEKANNRKVISRYHPVVPTQLETQELDVARAYSSGAGFHNNIADTTRTCERIGVGDWLDSDWMASGHRKPGALFQAKCPLAGGKADPEAYKGFRLQNGWKIKSVDAPDVVHQTRPVGPLRKSGFSLLATPSVGSDNPYLKAHIWSDPGAEISVGIRIVIEGPAGTDPYPPAAQCPAGCASSGSTCVRGSGFRCNSDGDCASGYSCMNGECSRRCMPNPVSHP